MPKFCIPNFSKARWQKVLWVLEGSFSWQFVLAVWQVCFSLVAVASLPLWLQAGSRSGIPELPTQLALSLRIHFPKVDEILKVRPG